VRELRHAIEFAAAASDGVGLDPWHLPPTVVAVDDEATPRPAPAPSAPEVSTPSRFRPIAEELRELERRRMVQALVAAGGVATQAADLLQMPRRTFNAKMREYQLRDLFPARR
jgi:DNA-binding NtrC family response regulator